jgi:hypothetical protein
MSILDDDLTLSSRTALVPEVQRVSDWTGESIGG